MISSIRRRQNTRHQLSALHAHAGNAGRGSYREELIPFCIRRNCRLLLRCIHALFLTLHSLPTVVCSSLHHDNVILHNILCLLHPACCSGAPWYTSERAMQQNPSSWRQCAKSLQLIMQPAGRRILPRPV